MFDKISAHLYNVSMNRNKNKGIADITSFLTKLKTQDEIVNFMTEILTQAELETLSKRWRIINMLNDGMSQRDIAQKLQVSLCKVTRGAKILKDKNSIVRKYLIKEKLHEI